MEFANQPRNNNYEILGKLVQHAEDCFRVAFREQWFTLTQEDWDPKKSPKTLLKQIKEVGFSPMQVNKINKGDIERWDLTLLSAILRSEVLASKRSEGFSDAVSAATALRNVHAHAAGHIVSDEEYLKAVSRYETAFVSASLCELMDIRALTQDGDKINATNFQIKKQQASETAKALNVEGKRAFKLHKYQEAIDQYSKALLDGGLLDRELHAELYVNRSDAYRMLGDYDRALSDGVESTKLCSTDSTCHLVVAKAWKATENKEKATESNEKAYVCLEKAITYATNDEIRKSYSQLLAEWKYKDSERRSIANLNSQDFYVNPAERRKLHAETGVDPTSSAYKESLAQHATKFDMDRPGSNLVLESNRLRKDGKFDEAFRIDLQCANDFRNPTAMYGVAISYFKGYGVERNLNLYIHWLKQAIQVPILTNENLRLSARGDGISNALYSLGNAYFLGNGVEPNLLQAVEYWGKADALDFPLATTALGCCYANGKGTKTDLFMALRLWRKAAKFGESSAMANLALAYDKLGEYHRALVWTRIAIDHGNHTVIGLQNSLEDFLNKNHEPISDEAKILLKKCATIDKSIGGPVPDIPSFQLKHWAENSDLSSKYIIQVLKVRTELEKLKELYDKVVASKNLEKVSSILEATAKCVRHPAFGSAISNDIAYFLSDLNECPASDEQKKERYTLQCIVGEHTSSLGRLCAFAEKAHEEFPMDLFFAYSLGYLLSLGEGPTNDESRSIDLAVRSLALAGDEVDGDDDWKCLMKMDILYLLGVTQYYKYIKSQDKHDRMRAETSLKEVIKIAEPYGHPKTAGAFFTLGALYANDWLKLKDPDFALPKECLELYESGKSYNAKIPTCFQSSGKTDPEVALEIALVKSRGLKDAVTTKNDPSVFSRRQQTEELFNPQMRIASARAYEIYRRIANLPSNPQNCAAKAPLMSVRGPLYNNDGELKRMTLEEIVGPRKDAVYFGSCLLCVVTAKSWITNEGRNLMCLIEDEERYPSALLFVTDSYDRQLVRNLIPGTVLFIRNPYARASSSGELLIRVDRPYETIKIMPQKISMCWGCQFELPKLQKCMRCQCAQYCSKKCQVLDWETYGHKNVCRLMVQDKT